MRRQWVTYLVLLSLHVINAQENEKLMFSGYLKNVQEVSFIDKLDELQWTTFFIIG